MAVLKHTAASLKALELLLSEKGCVLTPDWLGRIEKSGAVVKASFFTGKAIAYVTVMQPSRLLTRSEVNAADYGTLAKNLTNTQFKFVYFSLRTPKGKTIQYCQLYHGNLMLSGLKSSPPIEPNETASAWQLRAAKELYVLSFIDKPQHENS